MKGSVIILLIIILSPSLMAQGLNRVISLHLVNVPFAQFAEEIHKESGVKIWSQDKLTGQIRVSLIEKDIPVEEAINKVLIGTGLTASPWNGNIVILRGEKLITQLPAFEQSKLQDTADENQQEITEAEARYITGRKTAVVQIVTVGRSGGTISGQRARVRGHLKDADTGEPVINATIYIRETGTGAVTDLNGILLIILKPGRYNAVIEILGYEKKQIILEVLSDGEFHLSLSQSVIQIKEFVVYGDRQMNIKAKDPGIEKLSMKAIKELPMMMGERDILKVSGMLPGIVSTGEGAAGLNVRGGSSDQNAFYINKVPVYNTSHLFGFFPAFNSDIIKDFSIYKGHIPAQFGGRLSSVFNIVTRQGNRKRFTARGGVSPITAGIVVEGPLWKDTSSVMLSFRSSYSDWILRKLDDPQIRSSSANFNDFSGAINFDAGKSQFSLFTYHSSDRFSLADLNRYAYSNNGASLVFSRTLSHSLRGEFSLIGSQYDFSTRDYQEEVTAYEHQYRMGHYELRADLRHLISDVHLLEYGAGMILYKLNRGDVIPWGPESLRIPVMLGTEQGAEGAVYFSDSWDAATWLNITTGIRYSVYTPLGPERVYTYFPGSPVDLRYISDSIDFKNNKPVRWYHEPDIRMAINIETDVNGSVKLAFNRTHQNLFMLNNTLSIAPNTQWKLSDYHLKPSESKQISAGVFRILGKSGLDASAEAFYKLTNNYPEFKDGANFLESAQAETNVLQGTQQSYGIEFMLKRSNRKLDGWLAYTLSRTIARVNGPEPWDKINKGEPFPANFDIPNSVNLIMNYHMSRRITFSSVVVYQTGKPVTYPVSTYYIDGVPYLDYSARNAYRIPDYFRTDLSMTIEGNLRKKKLLHSSLSISVYNLSGRANPFSVYFRNERGRIRSYQYSVIGVPILTATWIFKLGNYASD